MDQGKCPEPVKQMTVFSQAVLRDRGQECAVTLLPKMQIEVVVADHLSDEVVACLNAHLIRGVRTRRGR